MNYRFQKAALATFYVRVTTNSSRLLNTLSILFNTISTLFLFSLSDNTSC